MAVSVWPNSSCSSRARWRSVDSRAVMSCCATSRRSSESAASRREQTPVGSDHVEARDRRSRRAWPPGTRRPADRPGRRSPAPARAVSSSLSLLLTRSRATVGAERGLPRLQRQPDLRPRVRLVPSRASAKMRSDASQNCASASASTRRCSGVRAAGAQLRLAPQRVVEIAPDRAETGGPRRQRIRLAAVGVEHVAHREPERVQVVLNPEQLQRVLAVPVGQARLQLAQAADLPGDVV